MPKLILSTLLLIVSLTAFAQEDSTIKRLQKDLANAKTVASKLDVLAELAGQYNLRNPKACQDMLDKGIALAEESRDREMMIRARRQAANIYLQSFSIKEYAAKATDYTNQAFAMSKKEPGLIDESIHCKILMARLYRNTNNYNEAKKYNQEALSMADETDDDSLKVIARLAYGRTQLSAGDKLDAFKSYIAAQTIAEKSNYSDKDWLQVMAYNSLSAFYLNIEDYDKAIDYQYKSLAYAEGKNNKSGYLSGLNDIGSSYLAAKKYTTAKSIFEKLIKKADSLKDKDFITVGQIGVTNTLISGDNPRESLVYLREHSEIGTLFKQMNMEYRLEFGLGNIYNTIKQYDSASYYFNRSIPMIEKTSSISSLPDVYLQYGNQLYQSGNYAKAITYLLKGKNINDSLGNSTDNKGFYEMLDSCYQKTGDFKNAFVYSSLYQKAKAELDEKGKSKDILAAEIDAENKRKDRKEIADAEATKTRHNWQYMGIVLGIVTLFILLATLGFLSVPIKWVRALGFISFIFLFEFIILLADNWIHHATHGEPWKVLAIKVVLIAILLPLHHFLEEKVIHYIVHRKHKKEQPSLAQ